jgi:hypothetical protein
MPAPPACKLRPASDLGVPCRSAKIRQTRADEPERHRTHDVRATMYGTASRYGGGVSDAAWTAVAALGAAALTALASLGVVAFQARGRSRAEDEAALHRALVEFLSRSLAVSQRAQVAANVLSLDVPRIGLQEAFVQASDRSAGGLAVRIRLYELPTWKRLRGVRVLLVVEELNDVERHVEGRSSGHEVCGLTGFIRGFRQQFVDRFGIAPRFDLAPHGT